MIDRWETDQDKSQCMGWEDLLTSLTMASSPEVRERLLGIRTRVESEVGGELGFSEIQGMQPPCCLVTGNIFPADTGTAMAILWSILVSLRVSSTVSTSKPTALLGKVRLRISFNVF